MTEVVNELKSNPEFAASLHGQSETQKLSLSAQHFRSRPSLAVKSVINPAFTQYRKNCQPHLRSKLLPNLPKRDLWKWLTKDKYFEALLNQQQPPMTSSYLDSDLLKERVLELLEIYKRLRPIDSAEKRRAFVNAHFTPPRVRDADGLLAQ